MTNNYDFVVTSGGIGPTHDDITYASLATAFDLSLSHHPETLRRMWALTSPKRREELSKVTPAQKEARERMALFPTAKGGHGADPQGGARSEVIFVEEDKWVPVVRLASKVSSVLDGVSESPLRQASFASFLAFPVYSSNCFWV